MKSENGAQSATWEEPSAIKRVAAAALVLGQNVRKTAEELGVDRRTIQRWQKHDPEFRDAMQDSRREVVVISRQKFLALADDAVELVERSMTEQRSPQIALAFVRGLGVLGREATLPTPPSPTPPARDAALQKTLDEMAEKMNTLRHANEAESPAELEDLPLNQRIAIEAFFAGDSLAEVAKAAKASEDVVRAWIGRDDKFYWVLSNLQFDRIHHLKHRLLRLTDEAYAIIEEAIKAGNARVALALVRGLGLMQ